MKLYKDKQNNILLLLNKMQSNEYIEIKANETDGAAEKHVPVYEIIDNKIEVKVGSIPHPMSEEHYIMWIALVSGDTIIIKKLKPGCEPVATFDYISGSTIYAYCNLHSIWKKDVD